MTPFALAHFQKVTFSQIQVCLSHIYCTDDDRTQRGRKWEAGRGQ